MTSIQEVSGARVCVADVSTRVRISNRDVLVIGSVWLNLDGSEPANVGEGVTLERIVAVDGDGDRVLLLDDLTEAEEVNVCIQLRASAKQALCLWKAAS